MANQKISELTAATTPLTFAEIMELVQSGANVKVAISNLFIGPPTAKIGDVTNGDYLEIQTDGSLLLYGDARNWDDLRVSANSTNLGGSKDPDFALWLNNGGASQGVFIYWFDRNTEEELYFMVQMPHGWAQGSDIHPHIHWAPKANGAAGAVVNWGLEYTWVNIGSTAGNTTIISNNVHTPADDPLVANRHYLTEFAAIDGTGKTLSSMLACRVFRDATGALGTDDYNADAGILEIDFHYQIESIGSKEEYS